MDNEQFNEFIRQLKEYYKKWQDGIEGKKKAAELDSLLNNEADRDKFWKAIAEELEKRTGESRLGGKYATDLAKRMFASLSKDESQSLIDCVARCIENQQKAGNQECK